MSIEKVDENTPLQNAGKDIEDQDDPEAWKKDFAEDTPIAPVVWGWTMICVLLAIQSYWVKHYGADSKDLKMGSTPVWLTYVLIQLVAISYSWFTVNYVFPAYPTIAGIPFFLFGFVPAFAISAYPFVFTDLGSTMAQTMPLSLLAAWSGVRLMFESTVQFHANSGVKGISVWLRWPIQKIEEGEYTLTYPGLGPVTRTHGGNVDAFSSLVVGMPTALICAYVNDDSSSAVIALSWAAQLWMFIYLCCLGPVPHFLGGMPGPNNIFDFKGTPKAHTQMFGLQRGTLGTCCYWIASYAVIHFIVFVRKALELY